MARYAIPFGQLSARSGVRRREREGTKPHNEQTERGSGGTEPNQLPRSGHTCILLPISGVCVVGTGGALIGINKVVRPFPKLGTVVDPVGKSKAEICYPR